jgi:hypothetical protein
MSDQSSPSEYDRRVKAILDRVAAGHLTPEEAATLIAALPTTTPEGTASAGSAADSAPATTGGASAPADSTGTTADSTPAGSSGEADSAPADSASAGRGGAAGEDDSPSSSVWAEVVDTPAPAGAPKHAAGSAATSEDAGSVVDDAAVVPEPAPSAESTPAAEPEQSTSSEQSPSSQESAAAEAARVVEEAAAAEAERVAEQSVAEAKLAAEQSAAEAKRAAEQSAAERRRAAEDVVEEESLHSDLVVPSGVRRVTIRAVGRRVRLIGEPAVTGVAVDGPHVIKRDGDTLAINSDGDMGVSIDGLSMLRNPTDLKSHVNGLAKELSIRVNPMLQVEIEVTGGSVTAERLPGLSRVRVTAGTAKVTDVDGPIDLLVQAGTASLDAQITKGRSRVRVESGAASVTLRRGSDVRVHTEAQLGRVSWTGAVSGQSKDVEIGRGRAALDVEVLVGSAQITSD